MSERDELENNYDEQSNLSEEDRTIDNDKEISNNLNQDYSNSDSGTMTNEDSNSKKPNNKVWIVLIVVVLIVVGVFYTQQSNSKKNAQKSSDTKTSETVKYSLNSEDEGKVTDVATKISSFYSDQKRTELKPNIDMSQVEKLKKEIDSISDETLKTEFLRLYEKLEKDIKNQSTSDS